MAAIRWSSSTALTLLPLLLAAVHIPSLASASPAIDNGEEQLMLGKFHGWMAAHDRSYASEEEKLRRFEVYQSNMEFIEAANRDSRFIAMYSSESSEMMTITTAVGPVHEGGSGHSDSDLPLAVDEEEPPHRRVITNLTALPRSVDWRAKGVVTPAKNQGVSCSSCWAFASVATMESAQAISAGSSPPVLSEQQLVDCDTLNHGCRNGWMDKAFNAGQRQAGKPAAVKLRDYKRLPIGDEAALMAAVAQQPVAVSFDYSDPCFQHCIGGVYNAGCAKSGVYTKGACKTAQNHALAIVGYGTKPDGTKYWIGKNSWTEKWGDNGFLYLLRDSPPLGLWGLAALPTYPII
ncbi:unnamed protein product [Urochloa decumbens]|uniref:Uncharacterized protein n=1 Tax=Urochloa decumbens TaxID=240449 RepID=A0ABC9AH09_9POAL